jgi:hypothetical protein
VKYPAFLGAWLREGAPSLSSSDLSQIIGFARISLIVGLVFLHYLKYPNVTTSPFDGMAIGEHQVATFINSFALFFFFSVVPLLSMISGWLFFSFVADPQKDAMQAIAQRTWRRLLSLYLPMVAWGTLVLIALTALFRVTPDHPLFDELNLHFDRANIWDYLNAVFGITEHPVAFQFWFVRDLFVTALVSPLLWQLLRKAPYFGVAFLGIAWVLGSNLLIFFRTDVVFFFYLGALVRIRQIPVAISVRAMAMLVAAYVVVVALRTSAPLYLDWVGHRPPELTVATRAMRLLGVIACWGLFQHAALTSWGRRIAGYGGLAFFLHAMHFPLIAEIKIVLWRWLPAHTDAWMVVHYIASVALTVAIAMSAGILLARHAPKVFVLMNGGRPLNTLDRPGSQSLQAAEHTGELLRAPRFTAADEKSPPLP